MNFFKKIIKNNFVYSIYKNRSTNTFIKNHYKTNFEKNVLISYITSSFLKGISHAHTNIVESLEIGRVFSDLGFNVDVVNYNSERKIDFKKYDVVFGFGKPLNDSFFSTNKKLKRIFYGTGKHPWFSNWYTLDRLMSAYNKTGELFIESTRYISEDYLLQTTLVDGIVVIGNKDVVKTYKKYYNGPIYSIPVSFYKTHNPFEIIEKRNYPESKKHFLFFSGSGMVHKGLDLLLDAFSQSPDMHLHICAPVSAEKRFENFYKKELHYTKNIHTYGLIGIESDEFRRLLEQCAFVIPPSCSEGESTAIVHAVANGGLIPLLSNESSLSIDNLVPYINDLTSDAILAIISVVIKMSDKKLIELSRAYAKIILQKNSLDNFSEEFLKSIILILDKYEVHHL